MTDDTNEQSERRCELRIPTFGIYAHLMPPVGVTAQPFEGLIFNLSDSGVGFISMRPLELNTKLRIAAHVITGSPRDVSVRWCEQVNHGLYRVGLSLN
jgi:hypothetical protein